MKTLRILIVEDDALIGEVLAEMLQGLGHEVCGIEATQDGAVQTACAQHPDLMIVDGKLRNGTGSAAMRQILLIGPQPHLFMGGGRIDAPGTGAVLLQKPFGEPELIAAIEHAIAPGFT